MSTCDPYHSTHRPAGPTEPYLFFTAKVVDTTIGRT